MLTPLANQRSRLIICNVVQSIAGLFAAIFIFRPAIKIIISSIASIIKYEGVAYIYAFIESFFVIFFLIIGTSMLFFTLLTMIMGIRCIKHEVVLAPETKMPITNKRNNYFIAFIVLGTFYPAVVSLTMFGHNLYYILHFTINTVPYLVENLHSFSGFLRQLSIHDDYLLSVC